MCLCGANSSVGMDGRMFPQSDITSLRLTTATFPVEEAKTDSQLSQSGPVFLMFRKYHWVRSRGAIITYHILEISTTMFRQMRCSPGENGLFSLGLKYV